MSRQASTTRLRLTSLEDRLTPAGGLDGTFGTGGMVISPLGDYTMRPAVLAQPDGHILVVSVAGAFGTQITRYNADGSLDTAFGTGGTVNDLVPGRTTALYDAAVGPGGKIILSGTSTTDSVQYTTAIVRLNADGTPDTAFGTIGVASIDATLQMNDMPGFPLPIGKASYDVAVLADGSFVVTGNDHTRGFTAVRLTPAGVVDSTFGVGGLFSYSMTASGGAYLTGVTDAATPDGGVLLIGSQIVLNGQGLGRSTSTLLKLTPAGTLDPSFDGDGVATVTAGNVGGGGDVLVVQPDGKVLVVMSVYDPWQPARPSSTEVVRLNVDGTPDAGFGGGRVVALPGGGYVGYSSVALLPDGRVVVASGRYGTNDAGVAVLNADGTPDDYFTGGSGVGGIDYTAPDSSVTAGGVTLSGTGPTVGSLAVSGDRIVVLSTLYSDMDEYYRSRMNRVGLAVLTEGPAAIPLKAELPVAPTPPEPPEPPAVVTPPVPQELVIIRVIEGVTPLPVLTGPVDENQSGLTAAAPVDLKIPPILPLPVTFPPILPQPVKVPGDFNGDGFADKVVTDGPRVSVVSGSDGGVLLKAFAPFEASYTGTLNAVFVDVDQNGQSELVVSPGQGGGPVVAVYNADGSERGRFWGIDDVNFRGGVNLATAANGLIVMAGEGGGPRVAIFDATTLGANARRVRADFFAFEPGMRSGVVATVAGDTVVFGAGPGAGPRVRGVDARSLSDAGFQSLDDLPASARKFDKFVGDPATRTGVNLSLRRTGAVATEANPRVFRQQVTAAAGTNAPEVVHEFDEDGYGFARTMGVNVV